MQFVDSQTMPDQDLIVKDLGPLSWVMQELRKSFDVSIKALERFLLETNATQSDLSAFDAGQLRHAKRQFHQVYAALKVLQIDEAAIFADAMETVAGKFVQRPDMVTEDAIRKLEHASFAVLEYLESLLARKNVSSIGLFVQYRDIKGLAGFDHVHPADLWVRQPFQWLQPEMLAIRSLDYSPTVRGEIDAALLKIMQSADTTAAHDLSQLSLSLAQTQTNGKASTFWKICAAFFEAIAQKLIPVDIYAKRTAAGIVVHYNNLKHGDWVFSDKFMHNMLFLCGQAKIEKRESSPSLFVVQKTWELMDEQAVNYEISQFGRFDPAVLALSKKRIVVAKELWTSLAGGDIQKIRSTAEKFKLVSESLTKLYPSSGTLAAALTNVSDLIVVAKQAPSAELAMEVATAILYLEAVFEGWGSDDSEVALRAAKLAQRIESVSSGGQAETVEPWIEELYRRVSELESMGGVVGELRICLTDIEKSIDQYFRAPSLPLVLQSVPEKLRQMRGIFSVLGLDEASAAVMSMRDHVEEFRLPNFDFEHERVSGGVDKFGNNLGALGFLIDMLNYQPALVKKLFVFDAKVGALNPLMGRVKQAVVDNAMRIEGRLDLANLIGSNTNEKPVLAGLRKIETDDEALLDALESFESLELSTAVAQPQEITAAESTVSPEDTVVESLKTVDLIDPDKTTNDSGVLPLNDNASVNRIDEVNIKEILQTVASPTVSQLVESESESEDKDQFKVIGALKIGIQLYNVYLNEADEWSRCLVTELDEWAIEFHKPLSISTVNFAHSLAGSSATVGFFQLSSLAKQLESALDKVFQYKNGTETEAVIFAQVAEECRRLLHQFAAGFLKEPKVSVVARLESLKFMPTHLPESNIVALPLKTVISQANQASQASHASQSSVVNISARARLMDSRKNVKESIQNHQTQKRINDDDIELVDSLDPDLFPIFEEEARELLSRIGSSLRQWVSNPDDFSARSEILRTLHTLKGSARLAGAMRLGELSHRMESEIGSMGSEKLSHESIEPFQSRLDSLQNNFENISKPSDSLSVVQEQNENENLTRPEIVTEQKNTHADTVSPTVLGTQNAKTAVKPPTTSVLTSENVNLDSQ